MPIYHKVKFVLIGSLYSHRFRFGNHTLEIVLLDSFALYLFGLSLGLLSIIWDLKYDEGPQHRMLKT